MSTRSSFIGTTAMASASVLRVAIQIAILPIIGRILGPNAYGQIALVGPFIFFAMLLAESGLGACIVRADKLTDTLEGTVFTFSTGFSIAMVILFAAVAYPLGNLLHEPLFAPLLIAMSSILILASFNVVPAALLLRAKRYDIMAISDIVSTLSGVVAIACGVYFGWGVWSLVAQQVVFWLGKLSVVVIGSHYRPRLIFNIELIKENIYFGSNLTGSAILTFVTRNIDNILIGAFMGTEVLGYYALAFQIVGLPQMVLAGSVYYTLFAGTSEARRNGESTGAQFLNVLRGMLLLSAPTMMGLAVVANVAVPLILGDKWLPAGPLIMLLAPFGLFQTIGSAASGVLIGAGRSDSLFKMNVLASSATILSIIIGAMFNSTAVAIGVSLASMFGCYRILREVNKECGLTFTQLANTAKPAIISAFIMGTAVTGAEYIIPPDTNMVAHLIASIIIGVASYVLSLIGLFHHVIKADIQLIRDVLRRRKEKAAA